MRKFYQEIGLDEEGQPFIRFRLTKWGVWCAAYRSRKQLTGWRRLLWPVICFMIFLVGLGRRVIELPAHQLAETRLTPEIDYEPSQPTD